MDIAILKELAADNKWAEVLRLTEASMNGHIAVAGEHFFRGLALIRMGEHSEGLKCVKSGLALSPTSDWGNQLAFEAHLAAGEVTAAFETFKAFIETTSGREPQKAWYVQKASEMELFHVAGVMNETRDVILTGRKRPQYALALQCFSKVDTLANTLAALTSLTNSKEFGLVVIVDSCNASGLTEKHVAGNAEVRQLIASQTGRLLDAFFSVEILQNEKNLGTAPTCRRMLDHVAHNYEGFMFIEDDCLLAPSALDWCRHHLRYTVSTTGPWFLSCESIFFDKQARELSAAQFETLTAFASQPSIRNAYHLLNFVPSTCFGTTSEIWNICANVRSFTRGPESLTRFMASMGRKTVSPIVPRASDIGMLHELGYSVTRLGKENVKEIKSTFLMAEGDFDPNGSQLFVGNSDKLYAGTSLLKTDSLNSLNIYRGRSAL